MVTRVVEVVTVTVEIVAALQLGQLGVHLCQSELQLSLRLLLVGLLGLLQSFALVSRRIGQLLRRRLNLHSRVIVIESVVVVQGLLRLALSRNRTRSGRGGGNLPGQGVQ